MRQYFIIMKYHFSQSQIIKMSKKLCLPFIIFVLLLSTSCQDRVDLLVHNAVVYTMNVKGTVASSFVVDQGKFIAVGGEELLEKYSARKVLNLQNLPVYPWFN